MVMFHDIVMFLKAQNDLTDTLQTRLDVVHRNVYNVSFYTVLLVDY